ncbi:MAG: radical SAM protein, partial [Planctomycetaceae bacterium]
MRWPSNGWESECGCHCGDPIPRRCGGFSIGQASSQPAPADSFAMGVRRLSPRSNGSCKNSFRRRGLPRQLIEIRPRRRHRSPTNGRRGDRPPQGFLFGQEQMRVFNLAHSILQNRRGAVPRPSWCTYLVCYRCNARCQMCDSWRLKPGLELTAEQVRLVFEKVGRLDVVRLTGGEPFLRDDFGEVARAVFEESRPSVLHITTNGSFPDKIARFVGEFPRPQVLRFLVSFDGGPAEHDANRGAQVTFQTACESVDTLV